MSGRTGSNLRNLKHSKQESRENQQFEDGFYQRQRNTHVADKKKKTIYKTEGRFEKPEPLKLLEGWS